MANISCSKDEEADAINACLKGTWNGTSSRDNRGLWVVTLSANGSVTVKATSTFTSDSSHITGKVTANGTLAATLGNTEDREFEVQSKENQEPMAAWIDQSRDREGTWQGSRE